jgi:sialate O-acetylesterase
MTKLPGVTITHGPADWQIIQRDEHGLGRMTIEGTWETGEKEFSIQARLVDENTQMPVTRDLDWQDAKLALATLKFSLTLKNIPAGGLYRVETRLRRPVAGDKRAMRGDTIHHLGVGDIYIIAGQSNASGTGKGEAVDGPALGVHLFANDEHWKLGIHPVEDATRSLHPATITGVFHGHSPWLAFGKRILLKTGIPIGLIPTALGGSPISMWIQDTGEPGTLFDNMMDMVTKAGGSVAGVLWHQGESDSCETATINRYADRFGLLVKLLREKFGKDLPVITGQINGGAWAQREPCGWTQIQEIQRKLAHDIDRVYLVVTVDCPLSDEVHNNAASNVIVGQRYADLALEHVYHQPILAEFPEPQTVRFTDSSRQCIEVSFINLAGDWTPNTVGGTFRAEDPDGVIPIKTEEILANNHIRIHLARPAKQKVTLHAFYGVRPTVTLRDDNCRCLTPFSLPVS